ncbi:hypothetical protein FQN57_003270 [Myotisia sp. PD_48]|nr:hypothetical protein FQN57_003270 [Myotisia sp. PD_48]
MHWFGGSNPKQNWNLYPNSLSSGSGGNSFASSLLGAKDQTWFKWLLSKFGVTGTLSTILSFALYFIYLKFVKKDRKQISKLIKDKLSGVFSKIPGAALVKRLFSSGRRPALFIPKATHSALASIAGTGEGLFSKLNPLKWKIFNRKDADDEEEDPNEKYMGGDSYGDPKMIATSLVKDLRHVGLKTKVKDLRTLIEIFKSAGKPVNDRDMAMEKIIAITASLPRSSKARKKLSGLIINKLWTSLQHPPMSYFGNNYQYRTADGSYNNPIQPHLGKAGSPYARSVPKLKHLHGVPPDPGLLFDLLMARSDESFKENPAGISSMLFYHATIIIHDIFRTNRFDSNFSDTSSYLDLAPLYGSSRKDQLSIRTMRGGLLKPDTFHEKRLLGQPPGVNVILIMYSRFHNFVADVLLKINENGRFTLPPTKSEDDKKKALLKQDEDVFQTARLVVNGLYINISLHDYLRGLTNTHHSASDWTLDPRVSVNSIFDPVGTPKGIGNQVSAEFNLLYRFHSVISRRDEKWMNEFFKSLFPDLEKPLDQLTPQEFIQGLFRYELSIPEEPSKREFAGLKRDAKTGKFDDAELVQIMKESMEDPAALFGPRMVPKALKIIEITGILTSRKWQMASLNEMRDFFKLRRHASFEDLNPDPEIADLLRKLYDHPDMVEMYPGMFLEDAKPRMDPGCGGCPPYTVGRAVFSDAVTLVRSDRFLTLDYTAANLTSWGIREVQQDYDILGGSMFHKLFQRALPGWFPYNSLHTTQPMFTRKMNEQIAREIGTIDEYSLADPKPPPKPVFLDKHAMIIKVLKDQANFHVPWALYMNDMIPGKKYDDYMLGGDKPGNTAQRNLVKDILYSPPEFMQLLSETALSVGKELLEGEALILKKDLLQVDIIRDIAIPLNTRLVADLFSLDLKSSDNPDGSLNTATIYKYLMDVRIWALNNNDPALALERRKCAREAAEELTESTLRAIRNASGGGERVVGSGLGLLSKVKGWASHIPIVGRFFGKKPREHKDQKTKSSLRWYGNSVVKELIAAGKSQEEVADICWLTAVAGVGVSITVFSEVLEFFLRQDNSHHLREIQALASSSNDLSANRRLRQYVLEAQRLTSSQRDLRFCVAPTTIDGQEFKPGQVVFALYGPACKDPSKFPNPEEFQLDRPEKDYIHFGYGPHQCLGREIALNFVVSLLKICGGLKNLRPAPHEMGNLKSIHIGTEKLYLNDAWSWLTFDPTTWKVHFEGYGAGIYQPPMIPIAEGRNLTAMSNALIRQAKEKVSEEEVPNGKPISHANGLHLQNGGVAAPKPRLPGDLQNIHPGILQQLIKAAAAIPREAFDTAQDLAQDAVSFLPGGNDVSKLGHGSGHDGWGFSNDNNTVGNDHDSPSSSALHDSWLVG